MRPDGWENPYPYNPEPTPTLSNTAFNAYEAGADAMLEALKKQESTVRLDMDGTSRIPAHGDYPEIIIEGEPYDMGWMVFIPEDNE